MEACVCVVLGCARRGTDACWVWSGAHRRRDAAEPRREHIRGGARHVPALLGVRGGHVRGLVERVRHDSPRLEMSAEGCRTNLSDFGKLMVRWFEHPLKAVGNTQTPQRLRKHLGPTMSTSLNTVHVHVENFCTDDDDE